MFDSSVHYHIKGIPQNVVKKTADIKFGGLVVRLYTPLTINPITFDLLLCRPSFEFNSNKTVSMRSKFIRKIDPYPIVWCLSYYHHNHPTRRNPHTCPSSYVSILNQPEGKNKHASLKVRANTRALNHFPNKSNQIKPYLIKSSQVISMDYLVLIKPSQMKWNEMKWNQTKSHWSTSNNRCKDRVRK